MSSGYRWAHGHIAVASLTASYDVEAFTAPTDHGVAWVQPADNSDRYQAYGELVEGWNGTIRAFGDGVVEWTLMFMTPAMNDYIKATFFPSSVYSAPATIRTRDAGSNSSLWRVLHCTAQLYQPDSTRELQFPGYLRLNVRFVNCKAAT